MKADFLKIVAKHQNILHKVCQLYADTIEDKEDLFQEILIQLWKSFSQFEGKSKISTWMYKVAIHTAITYLKKNKKYALHKENIKESIHYSQLPDQYGDEDYKRLHWAVSKLSDIDRAITLLYLEKHSYQEISSLMGLSETNIGVKINRIKSKLKNIMGQKDG